MRPRLLLAVALLALSAVAFSDTGLAKESAKPAEKGEAKSADGAASAKQKASSTASQPFMSIVPREFGEFSRLMFDWDRLVDYKVSRDGDDLIIRFSVAAIVEPLAKGTALPRRFKSMDIAAEKSATVIRIKTAKAETRLRHFQRGNRVVVDLIDAPPEDDGMRPDWAAQQTVTLGDVKKDEPAAKVEKAELTKLAAEDTDAKSQAPASVEPPPPLEPLPSLTAPKLGSPEPTVPDHAAPPSTIATEHVATSPIPGEAKEQDALATAQGIVPPGMPAQLVEVQPTMAVEEEVPVEPAPLAVSAEAIENGVRLRFPFTEPVASAVFRRMSSLWVVFDRPIKLDLSTLEPSGPMAASFSAVEQVAHDGATVLRISSAAGIGAQVVRSGNTWSIELTKAPAPALHPITPVVESLADGGQRIVLSMQKPANPVHLTDPEVGDAIIALPSGEPGAAVGLGRTFVQFALLPSAQGAAVVPQDDNIEFAVAADRVVVGGAADLLVSPEAAEGVQQTDHAFAEPSTMTKSFDYERWRRSDLGNFNRARQKLQNAAAEASGVTRNERRIDLARFLFAHNMVADALGVLQRVAAEDPKRANQTDFVALRGAARLLAGKVDDAARDLNAPELDSDADALLWRAALAATRGDHEVADSAFLMSNSAMKALPEEMARRFKLLAAHSALAVQNYHRAGQLIAELKESKPKSSEAEEIEYLEAQLLERNEKPKEALTNYETLAENRDGPVGVRASLSAIDLKLEEGEMAPRDAIRELESLRTTWRGDGFEQQLLKRLSELYFGEKDYLHGLGALRDAVERFPKSSATAALQQKMYDVLQDLFVAGSADSLTPLAALSLYYEFEDSAPAGAAGGRIVEGLANKLVAIDLLDRAAALIKKQVDKLDGADRARLGSRFATIKLLDNEADQALAMLKRTDFKGMPPELKRERNRIVAKVSDAMGKPVEALNLIEGDSDREAEILRADLQWDAHDWPAVAATIDRLYPDAITDPSTLSADDHDLLMRATVARSLAGDEEGVAALRERFGEAMKTSAYAGAFEFLTRSNEFPEAGIKELPKLLADVSGIEGLRGTKPFNPPAAPKAAAKESASSDAKSE